MKEAMQEANLTVIAIILIGVVAAVITPLVNSYLNTAAQKSCCTNAGYVWKNGCKSVDSNGKVSDANVADSKYWSSANRTCANG